MDAAGLLSPLFLEGFSVYVVIITDTEMFCSQQVIHLLLDRSFATPSVAYLYTL